MKKADEDDEVVFTRETFTHEDLTSVIRHNSSYTDPIRFEESIAPVHAESTVVLAW